MGLLQQRAASTPCLKRHFGRVRSSKAKIIKGEKKAAYYPKTPPYFLPVAMVWRFLEIDLSTYRHLGSYGGQ
jgi:hypothetical protein